MISPSRTALLVFTALLTSLAPSVHAAANDVCDAGRKKASLNFTVKDVDGRKCG